MSAMLTLDSVKGLSIPQLHFNFVRPCQINQSLKSGFVFEIDVSQRHMNVIGDRIGLLLIKLVRISRFEKISYLPCFGEGLFNQHQGRRDLARHEAFGLIKLFAAKRCDQSVTVVSDEAEKRGGFVNGMRFDFFPFLEIRLEVDPAKEQDSKSGIQRSFKSKFVGSEREINKILMALLAPLVSKMHRINCPPSGEDGQDTSNQCLKIVDKVSPRIAATAIWFSPFTENQGGNYGCYDYQQYQPSYPRPKSHQHPSFVACARFQFLNAGRSILQVGLQ